jgi:hypothetical protein
MKINRDCERIAYRPPELSGSRTTDPASLRCFRKPGNLLTSSGNGRGGNMSGEERKDRLAKVNYWDALIAMRDRQREERRNGIR